MLIRKNINRAGGVSSLMLWWGLVSIVIVLNVHSVDSTCGVNQFKCADKGCILATKRCDGVGQCEDNSDEGDICDCVDRNKWLFQCNKNNTCVFKMQQCDGYRDCPDGEDEMNCREDPLSVKCTADQWMCKDRAYCIELKERCDNVTQCTDDSDEKDCPGKCDVVQCHNGKCLDDFKYQCDGVDDCGDNSDEFHCDSGCHVDLERFACSDNSSCLPLAKVCDGKKNCVDGSDESDLCTSKRCSSLRCPSDKCIQLPSGPQCHCGKGYKMNTAISACVDVDECKIMGTCSQKCRNLPGSFECECVEGFYISPNGKSCLSASNESSWIYFTTENGLYKYNLEQNYEIRIQDHLMDVVAVAADVNYVYWTSIEVQKQKLNRMLHNSTQSEVIALNGVGSAEGLAVDWWTDNLYFTDNYFNHIAVCGHFGKYCKALITKGLHKPRGIALNPSSARMYWTDWGANPHIGVAYMDGTEQDTFVEKDVHWPNGITIDYPSERMYWVDAKTGRLESIKLNGEDRQLVRSSDKWHAFNVQVLGEKLYWTEKYDNTLQSVNKYTGKDLQTLVNKSKMRSLYVYHPVIHKPVNESANPCHQHHCSQLCLLSKNGGSTCTCTSVDQFHGEICVEEKNRILIGYNHNLFVLEYQEVGLPTIEPYKRFVFFGKVTVDRLAYNRANRDIIVADNSARIIYQIKLSYHKLTKIVTKQIGKITCLAVDHLANNLYWTDSDQRTVEMYSFDTKFRTTVHMFHNDYIPHSFVLAPKTGKIYVAVNRNPVKIFQMSMNGAGLGRYLAKWKTGSEEKVSVSMTIDEENSVIYLGLGNRIVSWNYAQNKELTYRSNLPVNMNQLTMIPGIRRFFWTGGNDFIYWDSKSPKVDKSLHIQKAAGATGQNMDPITPDHIPIVPFEATQFISNHSCATKNGGCSDICASLGTSYTCLCGLGRIFKSPENHTCIPQIDCEFRCDNGACLTMSRFCNGKKDCVDGSDEAYCHAHEITANHMACSYDEFKCNDGSECLEIGQKCDHHTDCKDGSDEWHCENFNLTTRCHKHQYLCNTTLKCVDLGSICDEYDDCGDYSDEIVCELPKAQRPSCGDLFDCGNGQCIDKAWICDGEIDCKNYEDESSCHYRQRNCREGFFECPDESCIHLNLVCDGHEDCAGGLDEFGCDKKHPAPPKDCEFQCPSNRSICVPMAKVCDGFGDCARGEDEKNCSVCRSSQFECGSANKTVSVYNLKRCIEKSFVCDKEKDCPDGSDEKNCDHYKEGSDDKSTPSRSSHVHCNPGDFHCKSGECVEMFRVCDLNHDCSDGSDEDGDRCPKACDKNNCQHECLPLPTGFKCSCFEGYELDADGKSCLDVNECLDNPCAQRCENTFGGYHCSCYPNFMLNYNKHRCKALGAHRYILYSSQSQVRKMSSFPTTKEIFWTMQSQKQIFGMAVNIPKKRLYVSSLTMGSIHEIDLEKNKTSRMVQATSPEKMAVDWGSGNVYIGDNSGIAGGRVRVCNFDSKRCVTIVSLQKYVYIDHLEVDARKQLLFFSSEAIYHGYPADKTLYSMRLDGTGRRAVYKDLPFGIFSLDVNKQTIYFVDLTAGKIMEINYDGHQERRIASGLQDLLLPKITAMAIFQNYVLIAMEGKSFYISCSVSTREDNCFTTQIDVANVQHFVVVQDTVQPAVENVCKNHRCTRMCIPTERGPKCMCNKGIQVGADEECPYAESDAVDDLVDVSENEVVSAMSGTDLEPSVAGRVILVLLFIMCGIAGITFFVYRRRYLMSTFTVSNSFTNVSLETSTHKDLPPVMYKPNINMDPEGHVGSEITFDEKGGSRSHITRQSSMSIISVPSTISDESGEFSDATHLIK